MKDLEKLGKLLHHWWEHNGEHAEVYGEWAARATSLGRDDLARILGELRDDSKKLDRLFAEAIRALG